MSHACSTCNGSTVIDSGYHTCIKCGAIQRRQLDQNATSFDHSATHSLKIEYTCITRFTKKIMAALQRSLHHNIDLDVRRLLAKMFTAESRPTPERFIDAMSVIRLDRRRRKPYNYMTYYYESIFNVDLPVIPDAELKRINLIFAEVFYASKRLNLCRPMFPMTVLLRLIVDFFEFSDETKYVVRFAKQLRCMSRRRRYKMMFVKCLLYLINHGKRTGIHVTHLRPEYQDRANLYAVLQDPPT